MIKVQNHLDQTDETGRKLTATITIKQQKKKLSKESNFSISEIFKVASINIFLHLNIFTDDLKIRVK